MVPENKTLDEQAEEITMTLSKIGEKVSDDLAAKGLWHFIFIGGPKSFSAFPFFPSKKIFAGWLATLLNDDPELAEQTSVFMKVIESGKPADKDVQRGNHTIH